MKLTAKFMSLLLGVLALLLIGRGGLHILALRQVLEDKTRIAQETLARTLAPDLVHRWNAHGRDAALRVVEQASVANTSVSLSIVCASGAVRSTCRSPLDTARAAASLRHPGTAQRRLADDRLATYIALSGITADDGLALEVEGPLDPGDRLLRHSISIELGTALLILVAFLIMVRWLTRRYVDNPIRELTDHAERLSHGELETALSIGPEAFIEQKELADKLQDVQETLVHLSDEAASAQSERAQLEHQLRHADRLASVGLLTASLIHDLGTPLNVVSGRAHLIEMDESCGEKARANAATIRKQATRISTMIREMLSFARPDDRGQSADALTVVEEHVGMFEPFARKSKVRIELAAASESVTLEIGANELRQVLNNLLTNAAQAMPDGGRVCITTGRVNGGAEGQGFVCVEDDGPGVPDAVRERIFEPFYTTKPPGTGTGLGLSVCRDIVESHRGRICVEDAPAGGARFCAYLPIAR